MILDDVITRLRTNCDELRTVGGAADFDAILQTGSPAAPAGFVIPVSEEGGENLLIQVAAQLVELRFAVIMVVRTATEGARGAGAVTDLDPVRASVRTALLGWQPTDAVDVCLFDSGALLDFTPGVLWWQDVYRTRYDIRSV